MCRRCGAPAPTSPTVMPKQNQQHAQSMKLGKGKGAGNLLSNFGQKLPHGSVWANPKPLKAPAPHVALERAVDAARSAGVSQSALDLLGREAEAAKRMAAEERPLGARLDSAKAKLAKAESRFANAEANVEKAIRSRAEASSQLFEYTCSRVRGFGTRDCEGAARGPIGSPNPVLSSARDLLNKLETSNLVTPFGPPGETLPESLVTCMQSLRAALEDIAPEPSEHMSLGGEPGATPQELDEVRTVVATQETQIALSESTNAANGFTPKLPSANVLSDLRSLDVGLDDAEYAAAARKLIRSMPY